MANWTGNSYVDALLLGEKWDTTNLTYYLGGASGTWSATEITAIEAAMQSWEDVADIQFTRTFIESGADFVEEQAFDQAGLLGLHTVHNDYSTTTIQANGSQLNGIYNYNGYGWDTNGLAVGGLGYLTLVHELGHGLGIDHTHDDGNGNVNFFPGVTNSSNAGDNNLNQDVYSVMSYVHGLSGKSIDGGAGNDGYGFVAGPMAFDIAAIQYLYGVNTSQNSGDNTYTISDANEAGTFFTSIWDTSGTDELVYAGAKDTTLDLRSATLANQEGGGGYLSSAEGVNGGFTIAADFTNALANVNGESGVIIENATGGRGHDTITGNAVANVLTGNAGRDVIRGGAGNDTIYGDKTDGTGAGAGGISLGSGQITKAKADLNNSVANAIDVSSSFSLASDADILNATTIPHVSILGTANGLQLDYYKVVIANAGSSITIDVDHTDKAGNLIDLDSYVRLINADGSLVTVTSFNDDSATSEGASGSISGRDSFMTHTFAAAGTYYIQMGRYSTGGITDILVDSTYELQISVAGEIPLDEDVLYGDVGNDTLNGGAGADDLHGGADDDTLDGGSGDDRLFGGAGADSHDGGEGFDTVHFGNAAAGVTVYLQGNGTSTGDAAGDTFTNVERYVGSEHADIFHGGDADDTIFGGGGTDTISGNGGIDTLSGDAGADHFDGGVGYDTVTYGGATSGVTVNVGTGAGGTGDAAGDTFTSIERIVGSAFDDSITGSDGNEDLVGEAGNDTLNGGLGDERLFGGTGGDALNGGEGFDTVIYVNATAGVTLNLVTGGTGGEAAGDTFSGIERIFGSLFADNITGSDDNDLIWSFDGNDILAGAGGQDTFLGGLGGDSYDGGADYDTVSYFGAIGAVMLNLATGGTGGEAAGDSFVSIERVIGSYNADTITGTMGTDDLFGDLGNDHLFGGAGNDLLVGGSGADELNGGADYDTVHYGYAVSGVALNLATGGASGEALGDSYASIERVIGSDYNDTITGSASGDDLRGGGGNDRLNGSGGNDRLWGDDGLDIFVFDDNWGSDTIYDFVNGSEQLDLSAVTGVNAIGDLTIGNNGAGSATVSYSGNTITLDGIAEGNIDSTDFLF